jgi:hypothetical protein
MEGREAAIAGLIIDNYRLPFDLKQELVSYDLRFPQG